MLYCYAVNGGDGTNGHATPGDESETIEEVGPAVERSHPDESSASSEAPAPVAEENTAENGHSETAETCDAGQPVEDSSAVDRSIEEPPRVDNPDCPSLQAVEKEEDSSGEVLNVDESAEDSAAEAPCEGSTADAVQIPPEEVVPIVEVATDVEDAILPKGQGDADEALVSSPTKVEENGDVAL